MKEREAEHDRLQSELEAAQLKLLELSHTESHDHTDSTDRSPQIDRRLLSQAAGDSRDAGNSRLLHNP